MTVCDCNSRAREAVTGGYLGLTSQFKSSWVQQFVLVVLGLRRLRQRIPCVCEFETNLEILRDKRKIHRHTPNTHGSLLRNTKASLNSSH